MDRTKPCKAFARNYRKCQQQQKKTWKCFRVYKMLYKIMLFFWNSRKEERYYKLFFSSKVSLHSFSCFEILVIRLLTFALFVYYCICGTVDTWFISFMAGRNLLDICFLRSIYFSALDWHALFVQTPFTVEHHKIYPQSCILIFYFAQRYNIFRLLGRF